MTSVLAPFSPVEADLEQLRQNLTKLVGAQHPILATAAEHLFTAGGKRVRPALVLLVARATMPTGGLTERHRRLAEITEMIHTASLVHDDVIDRAEVRRGVPTVNADFGNRVAVLAGDFLFAQSSWYLANLDNLEVVKLLSQVIKDFAEGELLQSMSHFDTSLSMEQYIHKSYYKTASLMANSAKAAAVLSEAPTDVCLAMFTYGRSLGISFQIIDDLLDFTGSVEALGKPIGSDLAQGNLTAPVLFAMEENPHLHTLIESSWEYPGVLEEAVSLVQASSGLERSREMARDYAHTAAAALEILAPSPSREALLHLTDYMLKRIN
ncbi:MAG: solanesyl diphosphate synthase [Synechococcaceae cyanobacterium SM2_3_1]|nr:solanesyl diphosphate synthase [Synechococcaceae cyanobacterium SM2_3_1]